jgi:hypothetical protein
MEIDCVSADESPTTPAKQGTNQSGAGRRGAGGKESSKGRRGGNWKGGVNRKGRGHQSDKMGGDENIAHRNFFQGEKMFHIVYAVSFHYK